MRLHRLIHESETCNVFLIEWPPGTGLDWHDHGKSHATIQILEGSLSEIVKYDDEPLFEPWENSHRAGAWMHRSPGETHKIWNSADRTAVSLHTYRPPLTVVYDEALELENQHRPG